MLKYPFLNVYPTEMEALTSDVENVSTEDLNNTEGWESSKSIIDSLLLRFHIEFKQPNLEFYIYILI